MQSGVSPIQFAIDARLDQSIDQGAGAAPGTLSEIINLRKDKANRLVKRNGMDGTATPNSLDVVRMVPRRDTVAMVDGVGSIHAYAEGVDKWTEKDFAPRWAITGARMVAQHPSTSLTYAGCCSGSGVTIHVYADNTDNSIKSVTIDETTGAVLRGPEQLAIVDNGVGETLMPIARIVTDGAGHIWVVIQHNGAIGSQRLSIITTTFTNIIGGGSWPARVGLVADVDTTIPGFDLSVNTGLAVIAYNRISAGTHYIKAITVNMSGAIVSTYVNAIQCRAVSVYSKPGLSWIWVQYARAAGPATTDLLVFDTLLALKATSTGADQTVGNIGCTALGEFGANTVIVASSSDDTSTTNPFGAIAYAIATFNGVATITTGTVITGYGCGLASSPFFDGNDVYVWVDIPGVSQAYTSTILAALTHNGGTIYTGNFVAALFPHMRVAAGRTYAGQYATGSNLLAPQKVYASSSDSDVFVWDGAFAFGPIYPASVKEYRIQRALARNNAAMVPLETQGLSLLTGGSQGFVFDGEHLTELGFCYPPEGYYSTSSGAGGSIGAGTYQYAVTYEFTDAIGNRHQSAPWMSLTVTLTGATSSVAFTLPSLRITTKQDREFTDASCQIVVWRTLSTDPDQFYRVDSVQNDPENNTVAFTDTHTDASIATHEVLYTARGELANEMPPPLWHAAILGGKVAGIDAEYRNRIVFSKPLQLERGPEFSSANETFVNGIGDLTALAEMDGTLYAFSATAIAAAAWGDGIDAAGQGSWPQPEVISRAAGCIDPRGICVTQDGILFVSGRDGGQLRIWLMPRGGGNIVDIGRKAKKYLDCTSYFTEQGIISAPIWPVSCVNDQDKGRVTIRFTDDNQSFALEYDYVNKGEDGLGVWSAARSENHDTSGGVASACMANGKQWIGGTQGIFKESGASHADDGVYISYLIRTHDIKPSAAPVGKLNNINFTFQTNGENGGVDVALSDSAFYSSLTPVTYSFDSVNAGERVHRQWQPPVRRSSKALGYALQFSSRAFGGEGGASTEDVIPLAVSMDYLPLRGTYRPMASERI